MAKTDLNLVPAPQEAPTHPQFPMTNLQIVEQGVIVSLVFAPNITMNCLIDPDTMHNLCRQFLEFRKNQVDQLRVIREVNKSKIN